MYRKLLLLIIAACFSISTKSQDNKSLFEAVERNDIEAVKKLLDQGANPNAFDEYGDALLMNAALYASADCMKLLLYKGADPNFKNKEGSTCLMFCVHEADKVKLLLAKGADINVKTKSGNTPLLIAVVGYNNYDLVKMLIDNGADPMAKNDLRETALIRAIPYCDAKMINLLVEKGNPLDSVAIDGTALTLSIVYSNSEAAIFLLGKGADPNLPDRFGSPLSVAVLFDDTTITNTLIKLTKNINTTDVEGISALGWVGYNEHDRADYAKALIDRGADVNLVFKNGSTPLSWALQKGNTMTVEILKKQEQKNNIVKKICLTIGVLLTCMVAFQRTLLYKKALPEAIKISVNKSLHRLEYSSHDFLANANGCHSCHGQAIASVAFAMANEKGFEVSKMEWQESLDSMFNDIQHDRTTYIECTDPVALAIGRGYDLWALSINKVKPNKNIHLVVHDFMNRQSRNGSWVSPSLRPPLEGSSYTATALVAFSIQAYAPEVWKDKVKVCIDKARNWLEKQEPITNEEKIYQLLGLVWTKGNPEIIQKQGQKLMAAQRTNGGWSQLSTLETDAYATGQSLYALHEAGLLSTDNPAYERGVLFLLNTQKTDGSWLVKSRSFAVQPFVDSGFPHGDNQYISAAGTGWATIALTLSLK